jgi:exopolysaccharide biosynthesis predicted pyruvyltransferase EpsI
MKFIDFLFSNQEKKIFVDPCAGNNGDKLIWLGMEEVLNSLNLNLVEDAGDSDLIIVNGGGMFIDAYNQGINKILDFSRLYPEKPLCIAPNSFYFKKVNFGEILDQRNSPLYLFSREEYSKAYIDTLAETRGHVFSYIDHDLAFNLEGSNFIKSILKKFPVANHGNVIVVDRMDVEHAQAAGKVSLVKKIYMAFVPQLLRPYIRYIRIKLRSKVGSGFTESAKQILVTNNDGYIINSIVTKDISRPDICDFDEFVKVIAEAEYVFSNRLHVGVLAYLLGRKVYMTEGSYHKIRGIYEFSMNNNPNVKLIESL